MSDVYILWNENSAYPITTNPPTMVHGLHEFIIIFSIACHSISTWWNAEMTPSPVWSVPRAEEGSNSTKTELVKTITEGQTEFQQQYVKSMETDIILDR